MSSDEESDETCSCSLCWKTRAWAQAFSDTTVNGTDIKHLCRSCFDKWDCRLAEISSDVWETFVVAICDSMRPIRYITGTSVDSLEKQLVDLQLTDIAQVNWVVVNNTWTPVEKMNAQLPLDILFWKEKYAMYCGVELQDDNKQTDRMNSTGTQGFKHYRQQQELLRRVQDLKSKNKLTLEFIHGGGKKAGDDDEEDKETNENTEIKIEALDESEEDDDDNDFDEDEDDKFKDLFRSSRSSVNWKTLGSSLMERYTKRLHATRDVDMRVRFCKVGLITEQTIDGRTFEQTILGQKLAGAIEGLEIFLEEMDIPMSAVAPNLDGTAPECIDRLVKIKSSLETQEKKGSKKRKASEMDHDDDENDNNPSSTKRLKTEQESTETKTGSRDMTVPQAIKALDKACSKLVRDAHAEEERLAKFRNEYKLKQEIEAKEHERTRRHRETHELAIPALHLQTWIKCDPEQTHDTSIGTLIENDLEKRVCKRCKKTGSLRLVKWGKEATVRHGDNTCTIPETFDADCSTADCGYRMCAERSDRWVWRGWL